MPMSITVDDELAQRLQRQAETRQISVQEWALFILGRALEFADRPDVWPALNTRRVQLIRQRHHGALTPAEEAELADLQACADKWLEPVDRQRLEMLKPYEELAQRLAHPHD